jgi:conjugative relaxase-like TrwC/TraI family protein
MAKTGLSHIRKTTPFLYYSEHGTVRGVVLGVLGTNLQLAGHSVPRRVYEALLRGFAPDGRKLVRNAGRPSRFFGYDLVVSLPKTFDVYQILHPESAGNFAEALGAALDAMVTFLEVRCAWARRGPGGSVLEKALGLLIIAWLHATSRSGDPNTHLHLNIVNYSVRQDGTTGALPGIRSTRAQSQGGHGSGHRSPFYEHAKEAGSEFSKALRHEITRMGYRTVDRADGIGFELDGVSQDLVDHFSTRRQEVLDAIPSVALENAGRNVTPAKLSAWAARSSRGEKPGTDLMELRRAWREEADGAMGAREPGDRDEW